MRKLTSLIVLCITLAVSLAAAPVRFDAAQPAAAEIRLVSESSRAIEVEFRLGTLHVDSIRDGSAIWVAIAADGMGAASFAGWPEVPQQSVWLRLAGTNPRLTVLESDTVHRVWGVCQPAPEPLFRSEPQSLRRISAVDFYSGNTVFPQQPAALTVEGELGSTRIALLTLNPVQVHAQTGEHIIHTRLRIRIAAGGRGALDRQTSASDAGRTIVNHMVLNPLADAPVLTAGAPRILLVTEPQFLPALEPFVEWKHRAGFPVRTVIYSQVAQSAAALRAYLHDLCRSSNPAPEYILLVGDVDVIPPFFGVGSSLTDHPYSLLNEGDYLPDIAVGRIPCPDVSDCADWVERLLAYERDAAFAGGFAGTVFSSNVARDPQHGATVTTLFQSRGMSVDRLQQPESGGLSQFMTSLNSGRNWIFYIGHGYAQGWSSIAPYFTNNQVGALNTAVPPIVVSVACATADLDFPGHSIAEHWLERPDRRGPLAYFGATESTAFFRSDTLGLGMLRAIFSQNCERLGTAADLGRLATAQCFPQPPGGLTEETIQQFVLLGDPSMRVFNSPPQPITVVFPPRVPLGTPNVQVSVLRGAQPLADALVCLTSTTSDYYQAAVTNAAGNANVTLSVASPAAVTLTVTGRSAIPFLGEIQVIPAGGAFIRTGPVAVNDADGDHVLDRGETLQLGFTLFNAGNTPTADGRVEISAADSLLICAPYSASFAPIAAGDTITLLPPLSAQVSAVAPDRSIARLHVVIIAGDTSRHTETLTIRAPVLMYAGCAVREDSGDGDGNPEAGELLTLRLSFENSGGDRATAVACSLLALPPQLTLRNARVDCTDVVPGGTVAAEFSLHAAPEITRGFPLEFGYRLRGNHFDGPSGWDRVRIGQVPVFLYVLDAMPQQVTGIEGALTGLGVEFERGALLPAELAAYRSIWIFCGIYPNAVPLTANDANRLRQYLNDGGRCYWEGGDVWVFDPRTNLHPYFRINGLNDGTADAGPVAGEYGTAYAQFRFAYGGENSFIDQLAPQETAFTILRNGRAGRNYPVCIAYAGNGYRTIGSSIEIGALADSLFPCQRIMLVREMLEWFGVESRADVFPPVISHTPVAEVNIPRPFTLLADVQDASGIDDANILWRINSGAPHTTPLLLHDGLYRAELPGAAFGSTITYQLQATDGSSRRNQALTPEYTCAIVARPDMPLREDFGRTSRAQISPRIGGDDNAAWTLTRYPDPHNTMLELNGASSGGITYTTESFDASRLADPIVSFRHYLRDPGGHSMACARVIASLDGGSTFPILVWEAPTVRHGLLEDGSVVTGPHPRLAGQANVCLRFEFSGMWYWRIGEVTVSGGTAPVTEFVKGLVIWVRRDRNIALAWNPEPRALHYEIFASSFADDADTYQLVGRTADTTFIDRDHSPMSRCYTVRAVLEAGNPASLQVAAATPPTAILRDADLRWNAKLEFLRRR